MTSGLIHAALGFVQGFRACGGCEQHLRERLEQTFHAVEGWCEGLREEIIAAHDQAQFDDGPQHAFQA